MEKQKSPRLSASQLRPIPNSCMQCLHMVHGENIPPPPHIRYTIIYTSSGISFFVRGRKLDFCFHVQREKSIVFAPSTSSSCSTWESASCFDGQQNIIWAMMMFWGYFSCLFFRPGWGKNVRACVLIRERPKKSFFILAALAGNNPPWLKEKK